jgi:type I restriction-modification system DNA methylase subunit
MGCRAERGSSWTSVRGPRYLHGIDADPCQIHSGVDSLASDPGGRYSVVMTNPPFGKKSIA